MKPLSMDRMAESAARGLHALLNEVRQWPRRIRSRQELAGMTAADLRDARITLPEAAREAGKPFWRS